MNERRLRWTVRLAGWLIRLLGWTWRVEVEGLVLRDGLRASGKNFLLSLWHGEILPLSLHVRGEGLTIMISEHGDGELIARLHESWGNFAVRGSTSRGAGRVLLGLVRTLESGKDCVITPDGPRGPAGRAQAGAVMASSRTQVPILPIRAFASRAWRLRSWDRFLVPKPFATVRIVYGEPWIAPDSSDESVRELERRLGRALPSDADGAA
ncbi:MAG: lysophospholipid acyltransferase family protein [Gemmatimonadaceae bacterium]